jgi:hypothetical protein
MQRKLGDGLGARDGGRKGKMMEKRREGKGHVRPGGPGSWWKAGEMGEH